MKTKRSILAIIMVIAMITALVPTTVMGVGVEVDVKANAPEIKCKCEGPDEEPNIPGTQIYPGSDLKKVDICACVCDVNEDLASVTAEVFYPNTTKKCDVTLYPCDTCDACTLYVPEKTETPTVCDCSDPDCVLACGFFNMAPGDMSGEYRVVVTAVDESGLEDKMQNRFFYESIIVLEIGSDHPDGIIDFGEVEICTPAYAEGYIHNWGNDPAVVNVSTEGLFGPGWIEPKDLDIAIDGHPHEWLDVDRELPEILYYCEEHVLNFSIHVQAGTPPGAYSGDIVFTSEHAPDRTILFENKDASDDYLYDPYLLDTMYGDMTFDIYTNDFTFNGYGLDQEEYSLIYYTDDWPGDNGQLIQTGTPDASGYLALTGTLPSGLPVALDYDYDLAGGKYAKIWLVPSSDYDSGQMIAWHPEKILFEIETITTV